MSGEHTRPPKIVDSHDFATTRWSIVVAAGKLERHDAREALTLLCEIYWLPLYRYVRRRVFEVAEAQDLTQSFFAELLEKNYVRAADPQCGRFRAFLLTAFKHFLSKQWEKGRAQKRGGGRRPLSFDFSAAETSPVIEPAGGLTAEQLYDRQWALTLLARTLQRVEQELAESGKKQHFDVLRGFIIGDHAGETYAMAAERLGMSQAAAKQAASRMRRRYRDLLRREIAQTVASADEVDDEIRNLFAVFEL
jgi:RNA polymerase sigma-70 factor (ECF subfamily)